MKSIIQISKFQIILLVLMVVGIFGFSQKTDKAYVEETTGWKLSEDTPATHLVLIPGDVLKIMELTPGDFLGALTLKGQCYGTIQINSTKENHCLTLYGDDVYTDVQDGFMEGEPILIRQFQTQKGTEKDLFIDFDPDFPNQGYFVSHGVSALKLGELSVGSVGFVCDLNFNLFPNPSKEKVTLTWTQENRQPTEIHIYNAFGQVVEELQFGITKVGTQTFTLDASDLDQGTYMVKMNSGQQFGMKKLIIMK
jgi:hypothetical protein